MKKGIALLLATLLSLVCTPPSFAAVATPSVASASNALPMEQYMEVDLFDDVELYSTLNSITNTVDYGSVGYALAYYDMSNNYLWSPTYTVQSNGYFSISSPSDYSHADMFEFRLYPGALPSSGKYRLQVDFGSNTGGFTYRYVDIWSRKNYTNADYVQDASSPVDLQQSSGDFYFSTTIDVNSGLSYIAIRCYLPSDMIFPYGGYVKFNFQRLSSSAETDVDTAGSGMSDASQDTAQNTEQIANNTQTIADNQAEIMDTIREQVQYITLQLEAFWNQLAGEFTNLFNKMTDQLNELMGGIDDQTEELKGSLSDVESEIDNSATEINNTINQSTNTITNGWDSSGLQQSGNELNDSLTQYDDVESGIHDTASDWLGDYTLPNFDQLLGAPGVIAACTWLGTFMQTVFVNMGSFNVPGTLSLVLIFVLILVGYYRIRR